MTDLFIVCCTRRFPKHLSDLFKHRGRASYLALRGRGGLSALVLLFVFFSFRILLVERSTKAARYDSVAESVSVAPDSI